MKFLAVLLLLTASPSFACEVTLPFHLIVMGEGALGQVFPMKECSPEEQKSLQDTLSSISGRVTSERLEEMLASRGHEKVLITPHSVHIEQFQTIVREQIVMPEGVQIKVTRPVNTPAFVALASGDQLQVSCPVCLFGTNQTLNVSVQGFDGHQKTFLASADFRKMVRAFRLITPVNSFSEVSESYLKEDFIETVPHTDLVTNLETLRFYKTNKPLKTGELLKFSDLNAVNLVRSGLKTEVILENQLVRIKTQGISRSNGSLGEIVEVFHPQKNKKYQGKVVDINKVLVEL